MKNLLLLIALMVINTFSWAQNLENKIKFDREGNDYSKDVVGGWYNYGEMLLDAGYNVNYYRNHLFPDSTVQVEFSSGYGAVWKHAIGQVFDPVADNWGIAGQVPIDVSDPYTVDSVRIWYRYYRHQNAAPDTIKVQVWNQSSMNYYEDPWTNGKSYATSDYDYMTNMGIGAVQEYTILLDDADTVTSGQGALNLAINFDVNPDEFMAITAAYFPGNPYNFGDTIDQYLATPPTNQINAFVFYNFNDNDINFETGFYNHGLNATKSIRYNQNTNGWNGSYYPGIAYFNYTDHNDIGFHVVGTLSLDENELSDFVLYPNPANETISLKLNEGIQVGSIKVLDLAGKDVTSLVNINGSTLNISKLADGNYFLIHNLNNETTTNKFIVNH